MDSLREYIGQQEGSRRQHTSYRADTLEWVPFKGEVTLGDTRNADEENTVRRDELIHDVAEEMVDTEEIKEAAKWIAVYVDSNPRRLKRILNVVSLAKEVWQLQENQRAEFPTRQVLGMATLCEQWPLRFCWIFQTISDMKKLRRLEALGNTARWGKYENTSLKEVYDLVKEKVYEDEESDTEVKKYLAMDWDPEIFDHLLHELSRTDAQDRFVNVSILPDDTMGCSTLDLIFNINYSVQAFVRTRTAAKLQRHGFLANKLFAGQESGPDGAR